MNEQNSTPVPPLSIALLPILFLIGLLSINISIFGDDGLSGSNQIVLILSGAVAALLAGTQGVSWKVMRAGILKSIDSSMGAILILLLIGSLAGTWMISGVVPTMIYYGLKILNPTIFLFAACVISAVVSLATGSSWSTIATVGIALLGIGKALGLEEGVIAGAIISGAYFGDKMSPLSDTTNLAPAVAGTDLFTHIRYMTYTTIPSITITLIIFLIWGFNLEVADQAVDVSHILKAIETKFWIHWSLLVVPLIVIFMIVKGVPALPSLLAGTLLGALAALLAQPQLIVELGGGVNSWKVYYEVLMKSIYTSMQIETPEPVVTELLSTKGMAGMLPTIWLILSAMVFGGIMESSRMLEAITRRIVRLAHSTGALIASTAGTCIFFNITASDQYLSIVVPGRMFADTYRKRGLAPENLSRTLEDSGTVTSVLVPWNTCGATQSSVLGVATLTYAPFAFFCILSPLMTMLFGFLNIKIRRLEEAKDESPVAKDIEITW
ncbi:Na+/H+ antiporter NhaC [Thermonema rossianum]|uniref:Na+/H+ antiporter NhaC n=1 Tax=Thermonema rossianum TaxID=55505 RepID=UPI000571DA26